MRGITPAERDFPFGKRDQTMVRDGYAMGVAPEIFEYVLWPTERRFRVNHPVVMNRLKALYRSWGIPCAGTEVYALRYRAEWLAKISEAGVRRRAEHYYQQLDALWPLRQEARRDLLVESRKHKIWKLLPRFQRRARLSYSMALARLPDTIPTKNSIQLRN